MSLATVCTSLAVLVGVAPQATWAGNPDVGAVEMVAWANEAQARVADEADWQALYRDGFADLSGDAAGVEWAFTLPADCKRLVPGSLWSAALNREVEGPLSIPAWEAQRHAIASPFRPVWAQAGGKLLVRTQGGGSAGQIVGAGGVIYLDAGAVTGNLLTMRYVARVTPYAADTDVSGLGLDAERLVLLCAVALYRDAKGLPMGSAQAQYTTALSLAKARDVPIGAISLGRRPQGAQGGGIGRNPAFILDEARMT